MPGAHGPHCTQPGATPEPIKPCPFCGGTMRLENGIISHDDMTEASRRDCPLKTYVAAACQLAGWNKRATVED